MRLPVRATLLAGIPLVVMSTIGVVLLAQGKTDDGRATLAVGVIVAATAGASVVYQVERWSLRTQTAVHFAIMLVTVLPALLLSGWFPLDTAWGYLAVVATFLATGLLLWIVFYVIFTKLVPKRGGGADGVTEAPTRPR
ncbi:DUF3021 domain-containing protein [Herbiconiux sp. A18JL235]|uniref:DUF3021 domain-containing protein n=1 Tax=Herbiconiux sp. A18JL235 TaxID=3152363 RepID=A0AB39BIL8_9MICO